MKNFKFSEIVLAIMVVALSISFFILIWVDGPVKVPVSAPTETTQEVGDPGLYCLGEGGRYIPCTPF